ncbi:C-C chemokine receptor type 3-like [Notolabrus celidotus]|uniref:C-C chemokine receptor type 3-like n=1 Tax=Notolabrus celidotus TaxID=1203425 RepID=UPI00148FC720|nr:C-C chemokine receptor type 3-like [Notolabrus celidotus]XP_034562019.1 C-C chemokine receptor type 3-like [Notolabrus celidotus]XP_034562020.1 C-C chemokine receptor type 3-like [Notolabrus celidotus]
MDPTTAMMDTTESTDYTFLTPVEPCNPDSENSLGAYMSIIYYFIFFFSVSGNVLVLVIIYRFERLTTVTNILLLNLVFSSLIFVSSLPFWGVYQQLSTWIFGNPMCKIVGTFYYLGFYSSVLFLTLLTFDRHIAVVYSLSAPRMRNHRYAVISCVVVWVVSSVVCIKEMILHSTYESTMDGRTYCQDQGGDLDIDAAMRLRESGFYIQLFLFLIFPLVVITYCYVRIAITVLSSQLVTKFKTVRLIFCIVVLFFVCWTPYNIALLIKEKSLEDDEQTCEERGSKSAAVHVTRNLTYIYFCISPLFYTFVGKKFQNYFRQMMVKRFPRLRKHISVSQQSRSMSTKSTQNGL